MKKQGKKIIKISISTRIVRIKKHKPHFSRLVVILDTMANLYSAIRAKWPKSLKLPGKLGIAPFLADQNF